MQERLQKVLAEAGVASRRAAEQLMESGRVSVNGEIVTKMGTKVDPDEDRILVDGKVVQHARERIYIIVNKPRGYVSTVHDPEGRRTVLELVGPIGLRLYPVGRLDMDTEGLLLLTNDGELTNALLHPRHEVPKTYVAEVEGIPSGSVLNSLATGIRLEEGRTAPADVKVVGHNERGGTTLSLTIHEGRKRQVRRMLETVGHPVYFLKRIRFGPLDLRGLKLGQHRYLTSAEVDKLRAAAGGAKPARPHRWRSRNTDAADAAEKTRSGSTPVGAPTLARKVAPGLDRKPASGPERKPASGPARKPASVRTPGPTVASRPARFGFTDGRPAATFGPRATSSTGPRPGSSAGPRPGSSAGPRPGSGAGPRPGARFGSRSDRPGQDSSAAPRRGEKREKGRPAGGAARFKSKGSKRGTDHRK
ncbi:MAG: pseudouridine synthase [Symbiobacteriia bacterium]